MKIKSENMEHTDPSAKHNDSPQPDNGGGRSPRWLMYVIFIVLVVIGSFIFNNQKNDSHPSKSAETSTVKKVKKASKVKSSVAAPASSSSSSSSSSASSSASSSSKAVDMTKPIQDFFTAYQQYDTSKQNPKARAEAMSHYATSEAVEDLIPSNIQNQPDQTSIRAVYTLTGPVQVIKSTGDDNTYAVTLSYKVEVNGHTNQYTDSYNVMVADGKITGANQTASVSE